MWSRADMKEQAGALLVDDEKIVRGLKIFYLAHVAAV